MAKTLRITIDGSEDSTSIEIDVENSQAQFVIDLMKMLNEARPSELAPNVSIAVHREVHTKTSVWDKIVGDPA